MKKTLFALTLTAFVVTACGGGGGGGGTTGDGTTGGGTTGAGTTGGGTTGTTGGGTTGGTAPTGGTTGGGTTDGGAATGGGTDTALGGQAGTVFGDSAATNGINGTFLVCPASITGGFSSIVANGNSFCTPACSDNIDILNLDNDEFGSFTDGSGNQLTCTITAAAPGTPIQIPFSSPINGCPVGGCPTGTFPPVFVSGSAGAELVGTYTCEGALFDVPTQLWSASAPTPFSVTLNADNSATIGGTATTWSFANGVLILEGNLTLANVAVGNGAFTSYNSSTSLTRCVI